MKMSSKAVPASKLPQIQQQARTSLLEQSQPGVAYSYRRQGRLISCSRSVDGIDFYTFLHHAGDQARFYWRDGRSDLAFAGVGVALSLMGWGEGRFVQIQRQAQELFDNALFFDTQTPMAAPRLFGGFAFRQDFVPDHTWAAFHPAHFVLPHYQLTRHQGQTRLTINALLPPDEEPLALRVKLHEALNGRYKLLVTEDLGLWAADNKVVGLEEETPANSQRPTASSQIRYPMSYEAWEGMIGEAIRRIKAGPLRKVVLARVCEVRSDALIGVMSALRYLDIHYPDCYTFLMELRPHHAFVGATPELLAAVNGESLQTMALAGSARRGATLAEDERLAEVLFKSNKDRHEHALVVDALRQRLAPLTTTLDMSDVPVIMKLNNIQHLYTPVQGRLHSSNGVLPLVETLHPTPALGGWPRDIALDFIQEHEQTTRGWYAAPVGWIDHHMDGAFVVAIRSAVIQRRRTWLYAGAGIVADSEPEREWTETIWKFRPILNALGVNEDMEADHGRR